MLNELINKDYIVVKNDDLKEECEYKENMYSRFKANEFNFKETHRLSEDTIYNFHKIFIDSWSIHCVKPCIKKYSVYVEHVKKSYDRYFIDKENQILLLVE